ncbi:endopeptidase [Streptococcus phage Javan173]|uniref:phage tail protein n=1 Tax=Streptococcus entericus TaxID=155680 RepID=UPI0003A5331E|nr:phage tail protein [Streptococcus entericus]QBX15136.1 endopeptidase [Streptococcus phage Javan173]
MITFLDERDVEYGALATIKATNAVNGERSISGEIISGDHVLSHIERGWRLRFEDEYYVITYAKPIDGGRQTSVSFDAVHQFFWDFDKSSVHSQLKDGSHTFDAYLEFIFKDSGYRYTVDSLLKISAFSKQSFGYKKRLTLFNDIIKSTGVEFAVSGKVVRILAKAGTDLSTVVRKNFNLNELGIEKNIGDFVTYQKGFGAWNDSEDHSKGRLEVEYESPLASVYGRLEAEPFVDERYTISENMLSVLKENVDNSYTISVKIDMEDLTKAGYDYTQPRAGDYIMAINETLGFQEKIRIVSYVSEYDVKGILVKHEVTCNDIGSVKKQSAGYSVAKKQMQSTADDVNKALEVANRAMVSADGKNTVYFGVEFPKDEPKGTLKKGDSLYLQIGEETKMYFWNGAEWEEPPVVNDVEKFKRDIAEEFETVNATMQANEAKREKQAREFLDQAGASTDLANTAKQIAEEVKAGYADTVSMVQQAKSNLEGQMANTKATVTQQAQQLADQARTQGELQTLVAETKKTAEGAKAIVTELSKTVNSTTGNLTSVTQRVASVETGLSGVREQYSQLNQAVSSQTGQITAVTRQTADLQRGLDGVTERFENISVGGVNLVKRTGEPFVMGYGITNTTWNDSEQKAVLDLTNPANRRDLNGEILPQSSALNNFKPQKGVTYTQSIRVDTDATFIPDGSLKFTWFTLSPSAHNFTSANIKKIGENSYLLWSTRTWHTENNPLRAFDIINLHQVLDFRNSGTYLKFYKPKLELGTIPTDWSRADEDLRQEFADYKRTVDENSAELGRRVQTLDGNLSETKTLARQTADSIEQLATKVNVDQDGRITRAESSISQNAEEIAKRLTRAEVDSLVDGKGLVSAKVFDNYKRETAQTIEHQLTETRGMIPKNFGGVNLLKNTETMTGTGWSSSGHVWRKSQETYRNQPIFEWVSGGKHTPIAYYSVTSGATYTFSTYVKKGSQGRIFLYLYDDNKFLNVNRDQIFQLEADKFSLISVTFTAERVGTLAIRLAMITDEQGGFSHTPFMLEHSTIPTDWSPALEDMVTSVDFNQVKETAQLYERTIGTTGQGIADNIARMAMTSNIFQVEVGKSLSKNDNLVYDPTNYSRHQPRSTSNAADYYMTGTNTYKLLVIKQTGHTAHQWRGFQVPLRTATFTKGEKLSYRVNLWVDVLPDDIISFEIKNAGTIIGSFQIMPNKTGAAQIFTGTFTVNSDTIVTDDYGLHVWLRKNGQVAIGQISIVRGEVPPDRFVDSTSAQEVVNSTRVTQLADSYAIKTLNSNGAVLSAVNVATGGVALQAGQNKLVVAPSTTYIQDGTIKNAMIESLHGGKIQAGSVTSSVIAAGAVNASHLVVDQALFDKLMANEAYLKQLFAKNAFITSVQSVSISANQISGGKLTALNGHTSFNLQTGELRTMGGNSGIVINNGAFDFVRSDGKSIAGYSTISNNNIIQGGAIGSHAGFNFHITTQTGARKMLTFTDDNRMMVASAMTIVSDSVNQNEKIGVRLVRRNFGGGYCTAIISSQSGAGIEVYDDGKVRAVGANGKYVDLI